MTRRAVFDCMVFLQAAARPSGPAFACFEALDRARWTLCVSPRILFEIGDVLARPELQSKFKLLTPERVAGFLGEIQQKALLLTQVPSVFALPRDPKDEPYLNLAIAVQASHLVTWNYKHLGYLMAQDTPEGRHFCEDFPEIRIVDPPTFLNEMRRHTSIDLEP